MTPHAGDTLVTLTVDPGESLEDRVHLLGYAFIKVVQGSMLRQVLQYDLINGRVRFVVAAGPSDPSPHGTLTAELADWPLEIEESTLQ